MAGLADFRKMLLEEAAGAQTGRREEGGTCLVADRKNGGDQSGLLVARSGVRGQKDNGGPHHLGSRRDLGFIRSDTGGPGGSGAEE